MTQPGYKLKILYAFITYHTGAENIVHTTAVVFADLSRNFRSKVRTVLRHEAWFLLAALWNYPIGNSEAVKCP